MFDKNKVHISLLVSQQNLKINYRLFQNDKMSKEEQSIFVLDNKNISNDAKVKLSTFEKLKISTYAIALCEDDTQEILSVGNPRVNDYKHIHFDKKNVIVLTNSRINNSRGYYNNGKIDYLVSPFTILYNEIQTNKIGESLNILILNDKIYAIILDKRKRLIYSCIKTIDSYDEIINTSFFEDDINKQKLYEEMYALELQDIITKISIEFYENTFHEYFINALNIYYNIKQLDENQIYTIQEQRDLKINYNKIDIETIMLNLLDDENIENYNFIQSSKKSNRISFILKFIIMLFVSSLIMGSITYYKKITSGNTEIVKVKKDENKTREKDSSIKKQTISEIALIDHIDINSRRINFLHKLFDTVEKDAVFKELHLSKDESTIIYSFHNNDSYEAYFKPKLIKLYENSENVLMNSNDKINIAIISNTICKLDIDSKKYKLYSKNKQYNFLSKDEAVDYLSKLLNINKRYFTVDQVITNKYISYKIDIQRTIKTPKIFFDNIDKINNQYYSIVLEYPLTFTAFKDKSIDLQYTLFFNQNKKLK